MSNILLHEDEAEALAPDLAAVLSYASSLQDIAKNYQGAPGTLLTNTNIVRDDEVHRTDPEAILALAPEREGNFFVVPKIITK